MKQWIELVRVRSSEPALRSILPHVEAQVARVAEATANVEAFVLQHALYDGDLAVVFVWRSSSAPSKSREALLVAQDLHRVGAVDHALWVKPKTSDHEKTTHS